MSLREQRNPSSQAARRRRKRGFWLDIRVYPVAFYRAASRIFSFIRAQRAFFTPVPDDFQDVKSKIIIPLRRGVIHFLLVLDMFGVSLIVMGAMPGAPGLILDPLFLAPRTCRIVGSPWGYPVYFQLFLPP